MLFRNFAEASHRPSSGDAANWLVDLPDDSSSALRSLLELSHSHYENLQASTAQPDNLKRIYDLVVLADKYDCISALRPWAATWMWSLKHTVATMKHQNLLRMSWISYQLGDRKCYEMVLTKLIKTCSTGGPDNGKLRLPLVVPPDLFGMSSAGTAL